MAKNARVIFWSQSSPDPNPNPPNSNLNTLTLNFDPTLSYLKIV